MGTLLVVLLACFTVSYAFFRLHKRRVHLKNYGLPKPQNPSLLWGDLPTLIKHWDRLGRDYNCDYAFDLVAKELGDPPLLMMDIAPSRWHPICIVRSPDIAEAFTKATQSHPYSSEKAYTVGELHMMTGRLSIISAEGEEWKSLRKRFSPGFQPQYLQSFVPLIVDKIKIFEAIIDKFAKTQEVFRLKDYLSYLTYDIISVVVLDEHLHAQIPEKRHPLVTNFTKVGLSYESAQVWDLHPVRRFKRWWFGRSVDRDLDAIVRQKFAQSSAESPKSRSITKLSFSGLTELTPIVLAQTRDQIKTFLFAGHDTTASTLSWCLFFLWKHPTILSDVRKELHSIFGDSSPEGMMVNHTEMVLRKLTLVTAVIKETLRVCPPASSTRGPKKDNPVMIPINGKIIPVYDMLVYISAFAIGRREDVWGPTVNLFDPYRWIEGSESYAEVPVGSWRPFERGPRNCIGQELAMLEGKIVLALLILKYDFEKVGLNGIDDREVYNTSFITFTPVDGMRMRVSLRQ